MKKVFFLFLLTSALLSSCRNSPESTKPSYQAVQESSCTLASAQTVQESNGTLVSVSSSSDDGVVKQGTKRKVIKTMLAISSYRYATASVAYVLLDDGEVLVFSPGVIPPYTKEEAKILMLADLGQDVYVETR